MSVESELELAFQDVGAAIKGVRNRVLTLEGVQPLQIGTTATTAKAGNYQPASTDITDSGVWGRLILRQVDSVGVRNQIQFTSTVNSIVDPKLATKVGSDGTVLNIIEVSQATFDGLVSAGTVNSTTQYNITS